MILKKLYQAMNNDLLDRDGYCYHFRMNDDISMVITKYAAFVMPESEIDHTATGSDYKINRDVESRVFMCLNGGEMVYVGKLTVTLNLLKVKVLLFRDCFGNFSMIRYTGTAEMLAKDKGVRCMRYQEMITWFCPDDDFPIYAASVIPGNLVHA